MAQPIRTKLVRVTQADAIQLLAAGENYRMAEGYQQVATLDVPVSALQKIFGDDIAAEALNYQSDVRHKLAISDYPKVGDKQFVRIAINPSSTDGNLETIAGMTYAGARQLDEKALETRVKLAEATENFQQDWLRRNSRGGASVGY